MVTAAVTERTPALALDSVPLLVPPTLKDSPATRPLSTAVPVNASTALPS